MATFEVTTSLIIHCTVKVMVEAESKAMAVMAVADQMPNNFDTASRQGWSAKVAVKPPKGVDLRSAKPVYFEHATGVDKARKVTP